VLWRARSAKLPRAETIGLLAASVALSAFLIALVGPTERFDR
jgi:hypothetical protein